MKHRVARWLSILGHPLLVLPGVALAVGAASGGSRRQLGIAALALVLLAATIQLASWWQVRQGRWQHVDASQRHERRGLNRFLLVLLAGAAVFFATVSPQPALALGLSCAAAMIAAGMVLARWLKLSLHASFAVFSAALLWALGPTAMALGLAFAAAVAWSRWVLGRHRRRELLAGALAGAAAGLGFWWLLPRLA
jgi:membrane-associated phospholipid phosphatase